MNITQGVPVSKNLNLKKVNYEVMFTDLFNKKFYGYICLTTFDNLGYDDDIIILQNGFIVGAYHQSLNQKKEFFGDNAIPLFFNNLTNEYGCLDIFSLTKEQTELILTFNEKMKNKPIKDIKYLNQFMNNKYKEQIFNNKPIKEESKYDLFKKIGLGNIKI